MSFEVSKKVTLSVVALSLLLSYHVALSSWKEKSPPNQTKVSDEDSLYVPSKPEIFQERRYRIKLDKVESEGYELLEKLHLDCFREDGELICEVNECQINKLQTSGQLFTIVEEGIRIKKLPLNYRQSSCDLDTAFDCNTTQINIPDNDDWVYSDIQIADAPGSALVYTIDVGYIIVHPHIGDLVVDLTDEDSDIDYRLWNREGGDGQYISEVVYGITAFNGEPVNQTWKLRVRDEAPGYSGYIVHWEIWIEYETGTVSGHVDYSNVDGFGYPPLQEIKVEVCDDANGMILGEIFTDENGDYEIDYVATENLVHTKVIFSNNFIAGLMDCDAVWPATHLTYKSMPTDRCGGTIDVTFYWIDICYIAAHVWDYIYMEREFVSDNYSSWTRPGITCWLDEDEFDELTGYSANEDFIYFTRAQDDLGWKIEGVLHEYAHAIHNWAYSKTVNWGGDYSEHYMNSVTDQNFAFAEGWAEFMSCIIPGDDSIRIKHNGGNMETNAWWMGQDGTNDDGSVVEGAVASALFDMQDDHYDVADEYNYKKEETANLYDQFYSIFRIFEERKPATIVDFANAWKNDYFLSDYEKKSMGAIFENHEIKYAYLAEYDLVPRKFSLCQNYPNPFNSHTIINYNIPSDGLVKLIIYNILGQKVKTCVNRTITSVL